MFYNYIYVDPRKPGKYTYENTNMSFLFEPFYVGKGCNYRYIQHLYESNLNSKYQNVYKNRKLKKLIEKYSKEEIQNYIIQCNFSMDEKWVLQQEKHLIKQIGRVKYNGPLTNLTDGGEGERVGSIYDEDNIYDLLENKEINIKFLIEYNKQNNINYDGIYGLINGKFKILQNRYCTLENKNYFLSVENNPYTIYKIYTEFNQYKVQKCEFSRFEKEHRVNINKLINTNLIHFNGYFLNKTLCDEYYRKYIIYDEFNEYTLRRCDVITFERKHKISNLERLLNGTYTNINGFFLDKNKRDAYYHKHIIYDEFNEYKVSISTIPAFTKARGLPDSALYRLIQQTIQMDHGFFLCKLQRDIYHKLHTIYGKDTNYIISISNITLFCNDNSDYKLTDIKRILLGNISYNKGIFNNGISRDNYYYLYYVFEYNGILYETNLENISYFCNIHKVNMSKMKALISGTHNSHQGFIFVKEYYKYNSIKIIQY